MGARRLCRRHLKMPKLLKLPRKQSLLFKAPLLPNTPLQPPLRKPLPRAKALKPLKRPLKRLLKCQTDQTGKILPIAVKPSTIRLTVAGVIFRSSHSLGPMLPRARRRYLEAELGCRGSRRPWLYRCNLTGVLAHARVLIHLSAWNRNSAKLNFRFTEFSELRSRGF